MPVYRSEYDKTLKELQAQLTAQLEQEQAEIASRQQFSEFMQGRQGELLEEQSQRRATTTEAFQEQIGPKFQQMLGNILGTTADQAAGIEQRLAGDTARQTARRVIGRAAAGEDITGAEASLDTAARARGERSRGLGGIEAELGTLAQQAAAPVAYKMELDRIVRPFRTQAQSAQIAQTVAGTQSALMQGQAKALGGLTRLQAGPVDVLANLYGQTSGAYRPVAGGEDVVQAQYGDYGYQAPFGIGSLI